MAGTFSNPGNAAYFADLGLTTVPLPPLHSDVWRPHPILQFIPIVSVDSGMTGHGVRTIDDWSAAIAFSENTALTDQAMPTINSYDPTMVGAGFSYSETVQGANRMTDEVYAQMDMVREDKVFRVMVDNITHTGANSIVALSSGFTDITINAADNLSLDGLMAGIAAVGRPCVLFADAVGIRGLMDSMRSEGSIVANMGLSEQAKATLGAYDGTQVHADGFVLEFAGCRIYQTNNREGDASGLYENGGLTHAIIMADTRKRAEAARGNALAQYERTAPPILLQFRTNPIKRMKEHNAPEPKWATLKSGPLALPFLGLESEGNIAKWYDISNAVAGHKADYGTIYDPQATAPSDIRCIQYKSTYQ